jgi:hypothetical protein
VNTISELLADFGTSTTSHVRLSITEDKAMLSLGDRIRAIEHGLERDRLEGYSKTSLVKC